jgi:hypothetical protein
VNDLSYENCKHPRLLYDAQAIFEGKGRKEGVDGRSTHQGIPQDANARLNVEENGSCQDSGARGEGENDLATSYQPQANHCIVCIGCVFGGAQRLTAYIESVTLKLVLAKFRREWIL